MKLEQILVEFASDGAVSAGDSAVFAGSLFGGGQFGGTVFKRQPPSPVKVIQVFKKKQRKKVAGIPVITFNE
jgi:hypothetical protein